MKILQVIAKGALSISDSYVNPRSYVLYPQNGFAQDQDKLRSDVRRVSVDMERVISRHVKQANQPPRRK